MVVMPMVVKMVALVSSVESLAGISSEACP